ncbi:hypothetical protein OPT61_g8996 [Boeremia exigua]|uniref:Uncharacterized protein n=1 Tax=Boeremia exigua TaxID=749465 RepID=A0ACC2HWJ5_9PLEO|nr:hypothetical protein OPT61_g8996 [Boeremia exigua]
MGLVCLIWLNNITSGNYGGTILDTEVLAPSYWQTCYPNSPKTPLYSPAICTGRSSVEMIQSDINSMGSTVWSGICCPSGLTYFGQCRGTFTTPFTALAPIAITTIGSLLSTLGTRTVWDTVTEGRTYRSQTTLSSGTLLAEPVTVMWQVSDLSKFPSAYATTIASEMGINLGDDPSMSTGAKAGIAVGAVLGFALLVGSIVVILRRRRTARRAGVQNDMPEMHGHSSEIKEMVHNDSKAEMDGRSQPTELDTRQAPAELEAPVPIRH